MRQFILTLSNPWFQILSYSCILITVGTDLVIPIPWILGLLSMLILPLTFTSILCLFSGLIGIIIIAFVKKRNLSSVVKFKLQLSASFLLVFSLFLYFNYLLESKEYILYHPLFLSTSAVFIFSQICAIAQAKINLKNKV